MTLAKRFLIGVAMIFITPYAHLWFGQDPSEAGVDGPEAVGIFLTMHWVGGVLAALYWGVTLVGRLFASRPRTVFWCDVAWGVAGATLAVLAGVTARYSAGP